MGFVPFDVGSTKTVLALLARMARTRQVPPAVRMRCVALLRNFVARAVGGIVEGTELCNMCDCTVSITLSGICGGLPQLLAALGLPEKVWQGALCCEGVQLGSLCHEATLGDLVIFVSLVFSAHHFRVLEPLAEQVLSSSAGLLESWVLNVYCASHDTTRAPDVLVGPAGRRLRIDPAIVWETLEMAKVLHSTVHRALLSSRPFDLIVTQKVTAKGGPGASHAGELRCSRGRVGCGYSPSG